MADKASSISMQRGATMRALPLLVLGFLSSCADSRSQTLQLKKALQASREREAELRKELADERRERALLVEDATPTAGPWWLELPPESAATLLIAAHALGETRALEDPTIEAKLGNSIEEDEILTALYALGKASAESTAPHHSRLDALPKGKQESGEQASFQKARAAQAKSNTSGYLPFQAENGSYYGEVSETTWKPKTVYVHGYFRKDGTYVRSHYRSK